eukprot:9083297-Alexandrium_andersonii.AAC.1
MPSLSLGLLEQARQMSSTKRWTPSRGISPMPRKLRGPGRARSQAKRSAPRRPWLARTARSRRLSVP